MTHKRNFVLAIILSAIAFSADAAIGQSAIITLSFPFGARSYAMGECGVTIPEDEASMLFNPACLGPVNERWGGGAVMSFFEPLLPAFGIPDLWHTAFAANYQPSSIYVGGIGMFLNYVNFGQNEEYNSLGQKVGSFTSREYVIGLAYGFNFKEIGLRDYSIGLSFKGARSALAPGASSEEGGKGIARTKNGWFPFSFDFGILRSLPFGLRIGFSLLNMGPSVHYIKQGNADPIPFTARLGLGYRKDLTFSKLRMLRLIMEYTIGREMVYNEEGEPPAPFYKALFKSWSDEPAKQEFQEINHHSGIEVTIFNAISHRIGFLIDRAGSRTELHQGGGVFLFNHFNIDWYYISSQEGSVARNGQWGISFTFCRMFQWSKDDLRWWEES